MFPSIVLAALTTFGASTPHRPIDSLLETVPANALAFYVSPGCQTVSSSTGMPEFAAMLLDRAGAMGLLAMFDDPTRAWIDASTTLSVTLRLPHTVSLLGISARPLPDGGHRLNDLRLAIVIRPGDRRAEIEERIQRFLNIHANKEHSRLSREKEGSATSFRLLDDRLPSWAVFSWGPVGDYYVLAVGEGTMERIQSVIRGETTSKVADAWLTNGLVQSGTDHSSLVFYGDLARLRESAERPFAKKVLRVQSSLRLEGVDQFLWISGRRERALEAKMVLQRGDRTEFLPIAGPENVPEAVRSMVPPEATQFAILNGDMAELVMLIRGAYWGARSASAQESAQAFWRELQQSAGVDIERDLLPHLGQWAVIHNYPPHALGIPLALTILIQLDGDPAVVRGHLDRLLSVGRQRLKFGSSWRLEREEDGIWCLQFGIQGPAIAVTENWVAISFSPTALRQNLVRLQLIPIPKTNF